MIGGWVPAGIAARIELVEDTTWAMARSMLTAGSK